MFRTVFFNNELHEFFYSMLTEMYFTKPQAATNFTNANRMADFRRVSLIRVIRRTEGASCNASSCRMEKLVNLVKFVVEKTSETSVNLNIQSSLDVIYIGANVESVSA